MVGNPQRYRAALQQLDNRHATAGCLLALLLLLPLAARSVPVAILSVVVLLYVTLVVPVATGFLSATVVFGWFRICTARYGLSALQCLAGAYSCLKACHNAYLPLQRLHTTTSQVLFNLAAERVLCPDQRGSCLYALLLCSILGYVHNSLKSRSWSQLVPGRLAGGVAGGVAGSVGSLVAARLAKAVVLAFGLLSLGERLDRLQPGAPFMLLCAVYFVLTQWPGRPGEQSATVELVDSLSLAPRLQRLLGDDLDLEGLEEWWVPLGTRLSAAAAAVLLSLLTAWEGNWLLAVSVLYACALVPGQAAWRTCVPRLRSQLQLTARFPRPSAAQLRGVDTCAVCLDALGPRSARLTPCRHAFHSRCLRECANRFGTCPLCKRSL